MGGLLGGLFLLSKQESISGEVPRMQTPLNPDAAFHVIAAAYHDVEGGEISDRTLALLAAQSAYETGRWQNMRNFNFGNLIKGSAKVPYVVILGRKWRAYATAPEGAEDWLRLIKTRYPNAWKAALAGDPLPFVAALGAGGYFREPDDPDFAATVETYQKGVHGLQFEFLDMIVRKGVSDASSRRS